MHQTRQNPVSGTGIPSPLRAAFAAEATSRRTGVPVAEIAGDRVLARAALSGRAEQHLHARTVPRPALLGGAAGFAAAATRAAPSPADAAAAPRLVAVLT